MKFQVTELGTPQAFRIEAEHMADALTALSECAGIDGAMGEYIGHVPQSRAMWRIDGDGYVPQFLAICYR